MASYFEARVEVVPLAASPDPQPSDSTLPSEEEAALATAAALAVLADNSAPSLTAAEYADADLAFRTRVTFLIDGVPFIDLVREAERPFAEHSYDERVAHGESPENLGLRGSLAGRYWPLPPRDVFLPSGNLLGGFYYHDFDLTPDDPRYLKSLILVCHCGNTRCSDLLATITVADDIVTWSDFCGSERNWARDLGPFVFDRAQYESQLIAPVDLQLPGER